jgi:23S rRNA (adenine2503-C2)-methyltransferase
MKNILDFGKEEMRGMVTALGFEGYRGLQLFKGLYAGRALEALELPKALKDRLAAEYVTAPAETVHSVSDGDGTEKFLLKLHDGELIECVLMKQSYGNTLCISTQAGCAMRCVFCASGEAGLIRNLSSGEMSAQAVAVNARGGAAPGGRYLTNLVLMGSGEPLHNYAETVRFLRHAADKDALGISPRNISLSTCGLADKIYEFAEEGLPVTLSLSLHSPFDETRKSLMPVAERYTVAETVRALKAYFERTGRRVIIEYSLIRGVNCSPKDAAELCRVLKGLACHVNLILLNPVASSRLSPCSPAEAAAFLKSLRQKGHSATVRKSKGAAIEGACGQLRRKFVGTKED